MGQRNHPKKPDKIAFPYLSTGVMRRLSVEKFPTGAVILDYLGGKLHCSEKEVDLKSLGKFLLRHRHDVYRNSDTNNR
jgi:hypothetical protein